MGRNILTLKGEGVVKGKTNIPKNAPAARHSPASEFTFAEL